MTPSLRMPAILVAFFSVLGATRATGASAQTAAPPPHPSYYTERLDDPKAVTLSREAFGARGDGVADDTAAIQKAIDRVAETTGEGIVFIPEGRYRLSATLFVWPGIRILGYGKQRPSLVLGERTPGFQDAARPGYMVFFTGRRPPDGTPPPDANPGTFYSAIANVDVEIGAGNPGAVGVRAKYAQHCFTSHMEFRIGSGLAGIHEGGNVAEDVDFVGGDYGIWTGTPSPSWQFTLLDARFSGQRKAAIREAAAGLTLIRPTFRDVPTAIDIEAGRPDNLFVKDGRFENVSGAAVVVSLENSPRTQINFENAACRKVPTFVLFRESGRRLDAPGPQYLVKTLAHGLHYADLGAPGETKTVFDAAPVPGWPPPVASDLVPLPPGATWVSARALGATGDGQTDDTAALQKAIDTHRTVYLPMGRYLVTDTLTLRPDSVLIGLHPSATQLVLPDRTKAFQGVGTPKPLLEAPPGGANVVIGLGLYTNGINPRAVAARWRSGAQSMMNDVRFLGGHGTNGLDGQRLNPYNNAHSADPDLARRWDSQYPSLWVTDGGGGTFFDLWTPSTFAAAGLLVSNTQTSGRVYQMSSEHHVRYEVQLHGVAHWGFYALQTEAERGESGHALQLEIRDSHDVTVANTHVYRVISSDEPFPWAVKLTNSQDIRFRGFHCYSNSKVSYDTAVFDDTRGSSVKQREFAWLTVSGGRSDSPSDVPGPLVEPGARIERLADGFHDISGGAVAPNGDFYFVDPRGQRVLRWSVADRRVVTIADAPTQPVNLAFDSAGHLLVVSYAGNGTVYVLDPGGSLSLLPAVPATPRPAGTAILPVSDWRLQKDDAGALLPRPRHYVAPDGATYVSATEGFAEGQMSWGVKSSDLIRSFGLQRARPGERIYLTSEAEVATWSALVSENGALSDLRLFADQGGEGVATDAEGNVYIAAGDVLVYDRSGKSLGRIVLPRRAVQIAFGGPDGRTLFLCARDALYAVRMQFSGRR